MTIRYTPRARSDLDAIFQYIAKDNKLAAVRVARAIKRTIDLIGELPHLGIKNARAPEFRSRLVTPYPYRVHYAVRDADVVIVHIRHTSRRPWTAE